MKRLPCTQWSSTHNYYHAAHRNVIFLFREDAVDTRSIESLSLCQSLYAVTAPVIRKHALVYQYLFCPFALIVGPDNSLRWLEVRNRVQ